MIHRSRATRFLAACTGALLITFAGANAQDSPDTSSSLRSFQSANGFLNRGLYELAAAEYRTFLDAHPDHADADVARYGLGVSLYRVAQHDEAITALEAIEGGRRFQYAAETATLLGQCHLALGRFDAAAGCLREVLDDHADHALADDAAALLTESLYRVGRYEEVVAPCRVLVERWPESPRRERCELFAGLAEMAIGRHDDSSTRFKGLLDRFPNGEHTARITLLLAQSLHHSGKGERAVKHYRAVVAEADEAFVPDALYGLAVILYDQGQSKVAAARLDDLLKGFPEAGNIPSARILRGRIHLDAGAFDEANRLFSLVARKTGEKQAAGEYWVAKCELHRGRHAAAAERLARTLERFPKSELAPEMTYDRAVALVRAGEAEPRLEILGGFEKRFKKSPLAADALYLAAATQHQQQQYTKSLDSCRRFEKRFAGHTLAASISFLAAENQFLAGNHEKAVEAYRTFLTKHAKSPERKKARYRLGMALHRLGRFDEAEPILAATLEDSGDDATFDNALLVLGDLAFQRGDWAEAESQLSAYTDADPDAAGADDAWMKIGLARHRQGRYEPALAAYSRLLDRFPKSRHRLQASFERGQALVALDRAGDAVDDFRRVLDDGSKSRFAVHACNHLAAIAAQSGEPAKAAAWYEQAARLTDDDDVGGEARFQRAQVLLGLERYDEAADVLDSLIKDHPRHDRIAPAHAHLAVARARLGQHKAALAVVKTLRRKHEAGLDASLLATVAYEEAWCHRALDHPEDAAEAYRRLLSPADGTEEGNASSWSLRGHARLELAELEANAERFEEAAALLQPLVDDERPVPASDRAVREQAAYRLGVYEYSPENFETAAKRLEAFVAGHAKSDHVRSAHLLAGESFMNVGAHERAATHLREAVKEGSDPTIASPGLLRLGECLAVLQHWARSEESFEHFLKSFPESEMWFQAQFGVGWARENQDRYDDAIASYEKVVAKHQGPTAARAQFQIGECLFAQKKLDEAARALLKVDILYAYPEWSAAALYEAGRCFQENNDPKRARAQFDLVRANYAETNWATLAAERLEEITRAALSGALPGR